MGKSTIYRNGHFQSCRITRGLREMLGSWFLEFSLDICRNIQNDLVSRLVALQDSQAFRYDSHSATWCPHAIRRICRFFQEMAGSGIWLVGGICLDQWYVDLICEDLHSLIFVIINRQITVNEDIFLVDRAFDEWMHYMMNWWTIGEIMWPLLLFFKYIWVNYNDLTVLPHWNHS